MSMGSPCRFTPAAIATFMSALSFSPPGSRISAWQRFDSSVRLAASRIETPCTWVICVFGSMTEAPEVSLIAWRG